MTLPEMLDTDVRDLAAPLLRAPAASCAALEAKAAGELQIIYFNWQSRFITSASHRVHRSAEEPRRSLDRARRGSLGAEVHLAATGAFARLFFTAAAGAAATRPRPPWPRPIDFARADRDAA
jgi:hypothetical protein